MNHWSVTGMARRLDWEKRQFDRRRKLSITDEAEFRESDMAANWIKRTEERLEKHRTDTVLVTENRFRYDEKARRQQIEARALRHKLEAFHGKKNPRAVETAYRSMWEDYCRAPA